MDLDYFKEQICEELDGAIGYIKHAIEIKSMNSSWGKMLAEMSEAEMGHAKNLYKMFMEYYKKLTETEGEKIKSEYFDKYVDDITDKYTEKIMKIEHLHKMYEM